jgi:hypothetical protein
MWEQAAVDPGQLGASADRAANQRVCAGVNQWENFPAAIQAFFICRPFRDEQTIGMRMVNLPEKILIRFATIICPGEESQLHTPTAAVI